MQARNTAVALSSLGVTVDLLETDRLPDLTAYDLIHLFNLYPIESTHVVWSAAVRAGKAIVLSTIYWDPGEFLSCCDHDGVRGTWWRETQHLRRQVLAGADMIMPNTEAELQSLRDSFGTLPPHRLVPNGVDGDLYRPAAVMGEGEDSVLCVGRISMRKNQLGLLHALRGSGLPVKFVGPVNDFAYYRACREAAWPGVRFCDTLGGRQLARVYRSAKVHALVSWYETPGLASLEAAASGCTVVSTDRGGAREYFGPEAWYCAPDDPKGIRDTVLQALQAPRSRSLAELIRARFNWKQAARETLAGYTQALARTGASGTSGQVNACWPR